MPPPAIPTSSPATAPAAPATTQRSCWRSTPREAPNRSTSDTRAARMLASHSTRSAMPTTDATTAGVPSSANGLGMGRTVSWNCPGARLPPTSPTTGPTAAATATAPWPPAPRPQPPVGHQQGRQGDPVGDRRRPVVLPDHGGQLGRQRQGAVLPDEVV